MPERKSSSYLVVFGALVALTASAAIVGTVIYAHYIAYRRVALEHVPPGAVAVAYVDVEKMPLFEPVRRYLLPLADEMGKAGGFVPRLERIKRRTGLNLALELREIMFCREARSGWVLVLAGKFPARNVVPGIARALQEEGAGYTLSSSSDAATLSARSGWALAQAHDGALVVASSRAALRAALPERDTWRALGLDNRHPGSFYASGAWLASRVSGARVSAEPALGVLRSFERVTGWLELEGPHVDAHLRIGLVSGRTARAARPAVQALVGALAHDSSAAGRADFAGERAALRRMRFAVRGPSELGASVRWAHSNLLSGAASLAKLLRNRFRTR